MSGCKCDQRTLFGLESSELSVCKVFAENSVLKDAEVRIINYFFDLSAHLHLLGATALLLPQNAFRRFVVAEPNALFQ